MDTIDHKAFLRERIVSDDFLPHCLSPPNSVNIHNVVFTGLQQEGHGHNGVLQDAAL